MTQNPPTATSADEDDDTTEGHGLSVNRADAERAEGDDDSTEGHAVRF